jgi:hypothetical protein
MAPFAHAWASLGHAMASFAHAWVSLADAKASFVHAWASPAHAMASFVHAWAPPAHAIASLAHAWASLADAIASLVRRGRVLVGFRSDVARSTASLDGVRYELVIAYWAATLASLGCSSSGATADAGSSTHGPTCEPDGGVYTCLGRSWTACPGDPSTSMAVGPCDSGPCMGCNNSAASPWGVGFACQCIAALDAAGASWGECLGTENTCQ